MHKTNCMQSIDGKYLVAYVLNREFVDTNAY